MGFYIRKSIRFGPLRFNLSKSGLGLSAGVKGFRVGTGPRGNYIHAGMGGLYYRQTQGRRSRERTQNEAPPPVQEPSMMDRMEEIESAQANLMVDHSAGAMLLELNAKRYLFQTWPMALGLFLLALGITIAKLNAYCIALDILLTGLIGFCIWWDRQRKTTVLFYDLQPPVLPAFESLHTAFEALERSAGRWHVDAQRAVFDAKYNGGADANIRRSRISLQLKAPPYVKTNISIMCLPAGRQRLYFFPDRILVYDAKGIGSVPYSSLSLVPSVVRFIESEGVPSDCQVVGSTWKYVNKSGGPDRRFRENKEIPIVNYTQLHFKSDTGLNELFHFSSQAGVRHFIAAINAYRENFSVASDNSLTDFATKPEPPQLDEVPTQIETPPLEQTYVPSPAPAAAVVESPGESKKFYYFNQGVQGPVTFGELGMLAQEGVISAETQVCSIDNQQWTTYQAYLDEGSG